LIVAGDGSLHDAPNAPDASAGILPHARQLGASLLDHVALRIELLSVEFQEEKARITKLAIGAAIAVALTVVSLVMIAIAILAVYWDTSSRTTVAVTLAVVFTALTAATAGFAWRQFDRECVLFSSSARELRRDATSLVEP
jgi:uncharacterized membrane protein YqjE